MLFAPLHFAVDGGIWQARGEGDWASGAHVRGGFPVRTVAWMYVPRPGWMSYFALSRIQRTAPYALVETEIKELSGWRIWYYMGVTRG